jgi:hypothetical protein
VLVAVILIAWLAILLVSVTVCRSAAHGDAALTAGDQVPAAFTPTVPKIVLSPEPRVVTSRGGRAHAARSATRS